MTCETHHLNQDSIAQIDRCLPSRSPGDLHAEADAMVRQMPAEAGTRRPLHRARPTRHRSRRVVVPDTVVLTFKVLVGAMLKLSTDQIREGIHMMINELDDRSIDPDCEPSSDFEFELVE
jgi:hypothetical protein